MPGVAILTDSVASMPKTLAEQYNITVVPLRVLFGNEQYRDGVDMTPDEFYHRLQTSPIHPRTSQPPPGDFVTAYEKLAANHDDIIGIILSSKLSGTYASAVQARDLLPEIAGKIHLIDTLSAGPGQALLAIMAAQAVAAGMNACEITRLIEQIVPHIELFLVVDTLEYLKRNGRIGRAQALLGSVLNVKPILHLEDGVIAPYGRERSKARAVDRMFAAFQERIKPDAKAHISVMHALAPQEVAELERRCRDTFNIVNFHVSEVSPVVGVNVGPGTVGICGFTEEGSGIALPFTTSLRR